MQRRHHVLFAGFAVLAALLAASCDDDSTSDSAALTAGSGGLVEFAGGVEAISSNSITLGGRTFVVDSETVTLRDGVQVAFSIVGLDSFVVIKASQNRNGTWVAREIKIRVGGAAEVKITGRVDSITSPDLVVSGRMVRVTGSTTFTGVGDPRSLADVRQGDTVTVTGLDEGGSLLALKIRVESKG